MNCRTVRMLGGQTTTPEEAQALSAHLATCPACMDELGQLPATLAAPKSAIPPPDLTARIMAQLPATPALAAQRERAQTRRRISLRVALGLLVAALVVIGAMGIFVDSSLPATLAGGVEAAGGRLVLALTLAAKPVVAVFSSIALPLIVGLALSIGVGNLAWRRLAQPITALAAVDVQEGL